MWLVDDYWSSLGAERRQQWRRRRDTFDSMVHLEPQRKGRRHVEESDAAYRRAVGDRLLDFGLEGWPRAPLAVDFGFATTRQQPAGIEAYAKHYQDLLEPRGRDDDVPPFLYRSDRQIKFLFVRCRHLRALSGPPHISLVCRPRRHAIADLEAAARLGFSERDQHDESGSNVIGDAETRSYQAEVAAEALAWVAEEDRPFAEWNAKYTAHEAWRAQQDALLHVNDRNLSHLLVSRASSLITRRPDQTWRRLTRLGLPDDDELFNSVAATRRGREVLDMLIQVVLPPLPVAKGGGRPFREAVRNACQQFVNRHTFLRPLVVPLRITLLVVPPAQGKDLDNIVLNVIRAVNAVLQPHPEPWLLTPNLVPADSVGEEARQSRQVGVASYQVIELARAEDDPAEGTLTMVLGHGDNVRSIWAAAAHFVDRRLERGA